MSPVIRKYYYSSLNKEQEKNLIDLNQVLCLMVH
jgi:hypothetical protein